MLDTSFLDWFRDETERAWAGAYRWKGALDVGALERRLAVRFPDEHRLFLATLHATTPASGFHDWIDGLDRIRDAEQGVIDGLVFDVEHDVLWPDSWGPRPDQPPARAARVAELVASAPRLFPICGHRFVVAGTPGLVLSIVQSDIIVYGNDLREYLMNELLRPYQLDRSDARAIRFWGELIG